MQISLREHTKYTKDNEPQLQNCDFVGLQRFLIKNKLDKALTVTPVGIDTSCYVGIVKYHNTQIEVLPKLLSRNNENNSILHNLMYMLSYTKKLKVTSMQDADLSNGRNPFLEILIREYAKSLFDALKRFSPKGYVNEVDNISYIKGKINFAQNMKHNIANKAKFYCEYDEFSENNSLNQLFLFVSSCLFCVSRDQTNRKLLKLIMNYYSDIDLVKFTSFTTNKIHLTRNQKIFETSFQLAKMFIENTSVELTRTRIRSIALMWDMNTLFEEFVYEIMNKRCDFVKVEAQKKKHLLRNSECQKRDTKVDIFVSDIKKKKDLIIDTKYKRFCKLDDFTNADVFQVSTYCLLHNVNEAILLYPQWTDEKPEIAPFELNTDRGIYKIRFHTVNLHLDLKHNISSLVQEIESILSI